MMTDNFSVLLNADNFSVLSNSCYLAYLSGSLAWNIFAYLFSYWSALFYWYFKGYCSRDWSTDFSWFIMASRWSRDDLLDGYAMCFWNGDTFWYLNLSWDLYWNISTLSLNLYLALMRMSHMCWTYSGGCCSYSKWAGPGRCGSTKTNQVSPRKEWSFRFWFGFAFSNMVSQLSFGKSGI